MRETTSIRIFNVIEKAQYVLNYCFNELKGIDQEKAAAAISITVIYASAVVSDCSKIVDKKYPSTDKLIREYLTNPSNAEAISIGISNIFSDFHTEIVSFIGTDPWVLHTIELRGDKMYILKSIDYRIMAWDELREQLKEINVLIEKARRENDTDNIVAIGLLRDSIINRWMLM